MALSTVVLTLINILAFNFFSNVVVFAFDSDPLQDFCVADLQSRVKVNGVACKDPAGVKAEDFFLRGLHLPGNTSNPKGTAITPVTVNQVPGLNTLGLTMARLDYEPNAFFAPHFHARATEMHTVLEGTMEVGFLTSSPNSRLFRKVLEKGDVFVVPIGLIHYQRNVGAGKLVSLALLNSQNPGLTVIPLAIFGSNPDIDADFLARAFAIDGKTVKDLQRKFSNS